MKIQAPPKSIAQSPRGSVTSAQLRSKAQEELDAAGGETIAAKKTLTDIGASRVETKKLNGAAASLLGEANDLRAEANAKLRELAGPRAMFSLGNITRAFGSLMDRLKGKETFTVKDLVNDFTGESIAARLEKLAQGKEKQAAGKMKLANKSLERSIKQYEELDGHKALAAKHKDNAAKLLAMAKELDARPPVATEPAPGFEPGRVNFAGGPRADVKLPPGPDVNAPLPGDKKASDSLVALRWACESAGIDWQGKGTGDLKKALASSSGGVHVKNGASSFEVQKRVAERLGLPAPKDMAHPLDINIVREQFARRDALGLSRSMPRAEFEAVLKKAGVELNAPLDQLAMYGTAMGSQKVADSGTALKADNKNPAKRAAFEKDAAALDASKKVMVDVIRATPKDDRRILALDAVDAVEVAHRKPGATTKLGAAVEDVTGNAGFAAIFKKALGLDDATYAAVVGSALRASEWVGLGELVTPSSVLADPGVLTDAQKKEHIFPLSKKGSAFAKEMGLLDDNGLAALDGHMKFTGKESPAAQLLGWARQMQALTEHRDYRPDLDKDAIVLEMLRNAGVAPFVDKDGKSFTKPASVNPALVMAFGPAIDDVIKTLRH